MADPLEPALRGGPIAVGKRFVLSSALTHLLVGFIVLFVLTALVSTWAAYDRSVALGRFCLILAGSLLVILAPKMAGRRPETALGLLTLLSGGVAASLGIFYLSSTLWPANEHSGMWLASDFFAHIVRSLSPTGNLHENLVANALVVLIPLTAGGTVWQWQRRRLPAVGMVFLLGIDILALIVTGSRGAMLGLAVAGGVTAYSFARLDHIRPSIAKLCDFMLLIGIIVGLVLYGAIILYPSFDALLGISAMGGSAASRISLWRDTLPLIIDYLYTGSGLHSTAMVYSTYTFLLHVPLFYHAHNLYLQIAVEQGLPGAIAFLGMMTAGVYAMWDGHTKLAGSARLFCITTLASLVALLVHGLFEAELYVGPLAPLLFLPFAFVGLITAQVRFDDFSASRVSLRPNRESHPYRLGGLAAILLLSVIMGWWPHAKATLLANLGAVAQTRAELGAYRWPEQPIQDEVRRSSPSLLTAATGWYQQALRSNPQNVTANRRLGQIKLSLGEYSTALRYLETAYAGAPYQRATRQMLGEAYAITGNIEEAVTLWRQLDAEQQQFELRRWWYDHIDADREAQRIKQALDRL